MKTRSERAPRSRFGGLPVHPVSDIAGSKTADPASGTQLDEGQSATYPLTFSNTGQV